MAAVMDPAANRVFQEFDTELMRAIQGAVSVSEAFSIEVPSSSRSTMHAWLAAASAFVQEWKDSRTLYEMQTLTWEVINRRWQIGWKFHADQLNDDLSGLMVAAITAARSSGVKWAEHKDSLIATTVQNGKTKACYDGQNFFSASHPTDPTGVASGTFSNLLTNKPLNHANLITALQTMRGYKLPDGSPWIGPNSTVKLLVDATNVEAAKQIVGIPWLTTTTAYGIAGTTGPSVNIMQGVVQPIYNGWFNNEAGTWYLSAENSGINPIMFQRRQGVETQEMGPGSERYFENKEYRIGQDARYEASYTHPQLMLRVEPT